MARLAVIGNSGTGKSWAAGALIERVLDPNHRQNPGDVFDVAVLFDYEDEERGLSDGGEHDPLFKRVDLTVEDARNKDLEELLRTRGRLRVVPDMDLPDARVLLGALCKAMMNLCKDRYPDKTGFMAVDEAHHFIPQNGADPRVRRLISGGRKHGVEFLNVTQRPASIHTSALGLADRRIYFRVDEKNDIRGLRDVSTFNAGKLKDLADRECIVENKSSGEHQKESTNNWKRLRPHHAKDDGIVDDALDI